MSSTPLEVKCLFFSKDTSTTEIYTLSLHDALPIFTATNRGHGGENEYHGIKDNTGIKAVMDHADTLPAETHTYGGKDYNIEQSIDVIIDDIIIEILTQKDVKNLIRNKTAFFIPSQKSIREMKGKPTDGHREYIRGKYPDAIILNDVNIEAAVRIYKQAAGE